MKRYLILCTVSILALCQVASAISDSPFRNTGRNRPPVLFQTMLLLGAGGSGGGSVTNTFTLTQHKNFDSFGGGSGGSACGNSATTCTVTVTSTGTGHFLAALSWLDSNVAVNTPTASTSQGTWTHCASCAIFESGAGVVDMWYVLSSTSGATTVTCNSAGGITFHGCEIMEFSYTPGPISADTSGNSVSASCTACVGPTLTITGVKDLFIVQAVPANACTAVNGNYTSVADFLNGSGWAAAINQTTYTAPTWTCAAAGAVAMNGLAIK